jgi:hypothetical protein
VRGGLEITNSPYLSDLNRLADVIASIQVMGTYKFYKLDFKVWADRISGQSSNATTGESFLRSTQSFFRLDSGKMNASLVWRRTHQKLYDVDKEKKLRI